MKQPVRKKLCYRWASAGFLKKRRKCIGCFVGIVPVQVFTFYKKRRRRCLHYKWRCDYQVIKMTIEGLAMYAGRLCFWMVAHNGILVMCNSIMEISLRRNADSENSQQHKSYNFLYGYLILQ